MRDTQELEEAAHLRELMEGLRHTQNNTEQGHTLGARSRLSPKANILISQIVRKYKVLSDTPGPQRLSGRLSSRAHNVMENLKACGAWTSLSSLRLLGIHACGFLHCPLGSFSQPSACG